MEADGWRLVIEWGREPTGSLPTAESGEWLVTNGLGGFASGTVAGVLTRRYHGLLVAALKPPLGRTLVVAKVDETIEYESLRLGLFTNRWADGTVEPHGYREIERFRLDGTTPVWTYACRDALLEKRVWMEQGANTTYVRYRLLRARGPMALEIKALVNYRDYHAVTRSDGWRMLVEQIPAGIRVAAFDGACPFVLLASVGRVRPAHTWHLHYELARERERGLPCHEDHLHAGTFSGTLQPGESVVLVMSTEEAPPVHGEEAWERRRRYEEGLLAGWRGTNPQAKQAPAWVERLVLAADQFIVRRSLPGSPDRRSIIAGYHWFGEWGRDTMVSLPGLTLATSRPEIARGILRTLGGYMDQGMLPNQLPEEGETAEYNTVDAALWFIEALRSYHATTQDDSLLVELFPVLVEIIRWYTRGTRYGIRMDQADALLYAGEPGVQLTWMDAKIDAWVVTPRVGKPVEVNALWYSALRSMANFSRRVQKPAGEYHNLADRTLAGFSRFWNETTGYCFDVVDGPDGPDATLRPNQLLAVSLTGSLLTPTQQRGVVDACARELLTSHGLRSLPPTHPEYRGRYGGDQRERDGAYHQGTVWGWLLGPFVLAHLRVYQNPGLARSFLEPMADHLNAYGLGTLAEIFDGDPPFRPDGCIAQAWTVGEVLRAWLATAAGRAGQDPTR